MKKINFSFFILLFVFLYSNTHLFAECQCEISTFTIEDELSVYTIAEKTRYNIFDTDFDTDLLREIKIIGIIPYDNNYLLKYHKKPDDKVYERYVKKGSLDLKVAGTTISYIKDIKPNFITIKYVKHSSPIEMSNFLLCFLQLKEEFKDEVLTEAQFDKIVEMTSEKIKDGNF